MKKTIPASLVLVGICLGVMINSACSSGGNGSPTGENHVAEVEPNDSIGEATAIGGSGSRTFLGSCDPSDLDYFKVESAAGTLSVTASWDGGAEGALCIGDSPGSDTCDPQYESPVSTSVTVDTPGTQYFYLFLCTSEFDYAGTVVVP